jgi:SET domain-containing protein
VPAKSLVSKLPNRADQPPAARRIQTRSSRVHGKGVFALRPIARGERIIEYTGEIITWKEAQRRHPHDPAQPNHTFYFHLDDQHVIDALHGGNASRWINHSCAPNCEADEQAGRIFIKALRDIAPGEELSYDYGLVIDEPLTAALKAEFPCWCGSPNCKGTLLSATTPGKGKKKKKKKDKAQKQAQKDKKARKKDKSRKAGKSKKAAAGASA